MLRDLLNGVPPWLLVKFLDTDKDVFSMLRSMPATSSYEESFSHSDWLPGPLGYAFLSTSCISFYSSVVPYWDFFLRSCRKLCMTGCSDLGVRPSSCCSLSTLWCYGKLELSSTFLRVELACLD